MNWSRRRRNTIKLRTSRTIWRKKSYFFWKILKSLKKMEEIKWLSDNLYEPTTLTEALEKIKKLKSTYYFRRDSEKVNLNDSVWGRVYAGDSIAKLKSGEAIAIATYGKNIKKWENVFRKGQDYMAGDKILEKNQRIMPQSATLLQISSLRWSSVVEGYVITERDIGKGELVNVYLFYWYRFQ